MRHPLGSSASRRKRHRRLLLAAVVSTGLFLLFISTRPVEPSDGIVLGSRVRDRSDSEEDIRTQQEEEEVVEGGTDRASCATVEKMGEAFADSSEMESLRVREVIKRHFDLHGAARVRELPAHQFCRQGFVIGKASEAGFGNEMQLYPFGDYISFTNISFTLKEVKHLWRKHDCAVKYGRRLIMRIDNFEHPAETNVVCSDWKSWKHPVIWFQGTTDAVAIQFFLKNVHPQMKNAALVLFGQEDSLESRPNVFGELMHVILSPTQAIEEAVDWVLQGVDPDVVLHMRMMTNRSIRAIQAAVQCIKRALSSFQQQIAKPRVVLVSDTPSFITEITPYLAEFAEVLHFNYKFFQGNSSVGNMDTLKQSDFRVKDWGPAPRWVAFVDFFLASRAKHAVVSGAHRRVGTTYAQLIAALAAANRHGKDPSGTNFMFFSSFQSNLLVDGLGNQIGWGHIWNRFAGPLSCRHQPHQCALTPLLPPAWWDGEWQSPIPRDIQRLKSYGVTLTENGDVVESHLQAFCRSREDRIPFDPLFVSRILPPLPRPNPHTPPPARDLFRFSASPFPLDSATKDWRRQMPEEDLVELKFRLCDGSDIGPIRYSSASTVAMLKERIISEWPRDKKIIPGVANDVKLISGGKILENNKTIAQCRSPFGELPAGVITMHVVVQPSLTKIKTGKLDLVYSDLVTSSWKLWNYHIFSLSL
ncbi:hypothetical protein MUK42_02405 [Musa troglodytarum]|uniref:Ubiquitin-like domain-containing protein n=1 Tax=Musa troglodytarum TaxID=320322 RepID=A0A9E7JHH9_9LILI|nr:hypothetical protein MUK42_02405 [Musa troglodytarum]